jgi:SAM-dependent methyltransferase
MMWFDSERRYKLLHEKHAVHRMFARATFEFWQRLGFHVAADHFYDPIPNTNVIRRSYNREARCLPGLSVDWESFRDPACRLISAYLDDYLEDRQAAGFDKDNYYFRALDALYYYAFLRDRQPRRVVEIGQGFSTRLALAALARNARLSGDRVELVSADPYPRLRVAPPGFDKVQLTTHVTPLQDIVDTLPAMLAPGDLLFVDSSHVFKFGSDVQCLFERVYPRLASGVRLHIHDILTPFDYPWEWLVDRKQFWNEQYFVESFLSFNEAFRIDMPLHYVSRTDAVRDLVKAQGYWLEVEHSEATSLYLEKVK